MKAASLFLNVLFGGVLLFCGSTSVRAEAGTTTFRSGPGSRVRLLELFTSEGCSSCPPAEASLSRLRDDGRLWREFVPVAFHVDYWDHLGWRDRFAARAFTERQRLYAARWGSGSVYTPGFVLDGRERGSGLGDPGASLSAASGGAAGALVVTVRENGRTATVTFRPVDGATATTGRTAFVALLGDGLRSHIGAGENRGRDLRHDFVALSCEGKPLGTAANNGDDARREVTFRLPAAPADAGRLAVAAWVTPSPDGLGAEQATGGWLPGAMSRSAAGLSPVPAMTTQDAMSGLAGL